MIEQDERLTLCHFSELVTRPPAPWQLRGIFREQSVVMLYAKRGGFKSFLALDMGASMATGLAWHGHEVVTPGLVIYIAAEGGGGMVQRARAWAEQHDMRPSMVNMRFITEPAIVTATSEDMDLVIDRIRAAIDWLPEGTIDEDSGHQYENPTAREWPVLIIIDTLARCFLGDENQQEDMGQFIQGVDRLKMEFNCSILILHHTGRDESHERGSTALGGACDTIYRLDADTATHELTLTNEKMKDSREPMPLALLYREVQVKRQPQDDPLEDLTSLIIDSVEDQTLQREAQILDALREGPATVSELAVLTGLPKPTLYRYLVRQVNSGQIIKEKGQYRLPTETELSVRKTG